MTPPLVSVIIPCFNSGLYLSEAIASALDQRYSAREIIVVDDGSTDDTVERIAAFRPHIRYHFQPNGGVGSARNAGARLARGEYVALLDADDVWLPTKLERQVEVARRWPDSGMIVCDGVEFQGAQVLAHRLLSGPLADALDLSPMRELTGNFYADLIMHNAIACPSQTLIPKKVFDRVGPITESRSDSEDWDYTLRISAFDPITFHADSLVKWRYVESGLSGPTDVRSIVWDLRRIPVIRRHLKRCAPQARRLFLARRRQVVRSAARAAYYFGRTRDRSRGRALLVRLCRLTGSDPVAVFYLTALSLPAGLVARASAVWRSRDAPRSRRL